MSLSPQPGFQTDFLAANAQIKIGGGAAGCGKTRILLHSYLRDDWINNKKFEGIVFRQTYPQIKGAGGLWSESMDFFPQLNGKPNLSDYKWTFPLGSSIKFNPLQYDRDVINYQGHQIPGIGFDELTQFSEYQFFYLLSRNRSASIKRTELMATCNPDPDSFVATLIDWWIDVDGFPIAERSGINRYFIRINNNLVWGASRNDVIKNAGDALEPIYAICKRENLNVNDFIKSITFVPGKIFDNKILMKNNPGYIANLYAMPEEERLRYLDGNWKIKLDGNMLADFDKIEGMINYTPIQAPGRFITCDAAAHGRDLMVIFVWFGWCVVAISIQTKSDPRLIAGEIEKLRIKYNVPRNKVVIDSDGVGNDVVKLGNYLAFHGGAKCLYDSTINKREAYKNLKTQCFYRIANRINRLELGFQLTYDSVFVDGKQTDSIVLKSKVIKVTELIKRHWRAIRKKNMDNEGKIQINSKDEQKIILMDESPDFADTTMMREYFEFNKPFM